MNKGDLSGSAQIQVVHLADGQGDLRGTACGRQDGYDGWYDGIVVTKDKSAVTCPECLAGPNDGT